MSRKNIIKTLRNRYEFDWILFLIIKYNWGYDSASEYRIFKIIGYNPLWLEVPWGEVKDLKFRIGTAFANAIVTKMDIFWIPLLFIFHRKEYKIKPEVFFV